MFELTPVKILAAGASVLVACATVGAGTAAAASPVPLSTQFRACDHTNLEFVDATGYGVGVAYIGPSGNGTFVAKIDLNSALPNTRYDVRVIQTPRPSIGCAAGAPGVVTGSLQTDGVGLGSTTLTGPIGEGKTGAWVSVELPSPFSQTPTETYTTDFIAAL